jgi:DHA2 family multidrug resistance protein
MESPKPTQDSLVVTGWLRWAITAAVMLVAVIEVLDMTIVNVALDHMMGALGATRDQVTWVLTSYIVSSAIVMPLTGFLVGVVGRKRLLLINIVGFMVTSALCGLSTSLFEMVIFRVLQGLFGASLIPISQYVLLDTFSKNEHGKAMAIWGIGVMVGPVLGPTLGGYITEIWNWRWIFYINVPVCVLAFFLTLEVIKETPRTKRRIDSVGLSLMVVGIGSLQIFLDRGQTDDWFEATHITLLLMLSIVSLTIFVIRGLRVQNNIINLHLFKDVNFAQSCLAMLLFVMGVFSLIALQPLMLQELMGYSPDVAGLVMGPRGISSALAMVFVAKFITKFDPRWLLSAGLSILIFTCYLMSNFTLGVSFEVMIMVSFLQGFGVGLFFVPISTLAFATLPPDQQAEGAGLFNFFRSLGTSIGISLVSTYLARASQTSWNNLAANFSVTDPNLQNWLRAKHLTLQDPEAIAHLAKELGRQSGMVAFVNAYWLIGMFFILALPLVIFLKPPKVRELKIIE